MRVKGILQNDINDCGVACLATVCSYFNYKVPLIKIRELIKCPEEGISILDICKAAEKLNLNTEALYGTWEELYNEIILTHKLPIIVHTETNEGYQHYIVVYKYFRKKVFVFDPGEGHKVYSRREFCDIWSGYLITFKPEKSFSKYKYINHYKKYIDVVWENKKYICLSIFLFTVIIGLEVIGAMTYQIVIDRYVLGSRDTSFIGQISLIKDNIHIVFFSLIFIYIISFFVEIVEDSVYRNVISQYEFDDKTNWGQLVEQGVYPVVLDDYIPIKKGKDNYTSYQKVLSDLKGEYMPIQFGMYGDYVMFDEGARDNLIYLTKDANTILYVNGTLSERFPIPIVPGAYGFVADDYTQMESYYIRCYMPYSMFQKFLQDEQIRKTYGVLDAGAMEHPTDPKEYNPIMNYMVMNRIPETDEKKIEKDIARIMNELDLRSIGFGIPEGEYVNASHTWEYGNIENWDRTQMMKNANEILKRIFLIGAILLVLFFTIFSLVSYVAITIYLRRRELSILKSMGMGYKSLRKMLLYENAVLIGFSAICGTVMSWFIAYGKNEIMRFDNEKEYSQKNMKEFLKEALNQ